jgi:hypothetical protein
MTPFVTVPFALSPINFAWLKEFVAPIVLDYQITAPLDNGLLHFNSVQSDRLVTSETWKEIVNAMSGYGIVDPSPQLFVYKRLPKPRDVILGNPHIDTTGKTGVDIEVPIRFNILVTGEDNTEMVWWDIDWRDHRVETIQFPNQRNELVGRLQARGKSLEDRWSTVGDPVAKANNLTKIQQHASFVRTDRLHALNWTGRQPRVILSVRSCQPWNSIIL